MRRSIWAIASVLLLLTVFGSGASNAYGRERDEKFPTVIDLPNGWQPEGIVAGKGSVIYAGSLATGSIYAADAKTGAGKVLVDVKGRVAVGLSYDKRSNYIFVAGGPTGKAWVYDAETGATVGEFTLGQGFINDVIVTRNAAYFTNSSAAEFYRLPLGKGGSLPAPGAVQTIALSGEWQQVQGFNANGIEATSGGKYLIIVNSTVGKLYRVNPTTGTAQAIDLGGYSVAAGDGLLLKGRTLFVVRNQLNTVAQIKLSGSFLHGRLVAELTEPADRLDVPTTITAVKGELYVVNARFNTPPQPDTTYTIVRLAKPTREND